MDYDMGEMRTGYIMGKKYYVAEEAINENQYYVLFRPPSDELEMSKTDRVLVQVFVEENTTRQRIPEPVDLTNDRQYELVVDFNERRGRFEKKEKTFARLVSELVNTAVCEVEGKQEERQYFADSVTAALQSNKEVHTEGDHSA